MDIYKLTISAIERNEFVSFLRGDGKYCVEVDRMVPNASATDKGKVLSQGVYKAFETNPQVKQIFEESLIKLLEGSNSDAYMAVSYIFTQLLREDDGRSPFRLDKIVLDKIREEIPKRRQSFMNGVGFPHGFSCMDAWEHILNLNRTIKEELQIELFEEDTSWR